MKVARRRSAAFVFALVTSVLIGVLSINTVHSRQDRNKVAMMTEKMKTVCVGRFLIDVPEKAEVSLSRAFLDGFNIATARESEAAFIARVAAREAEINATPNRFSRRNMESANAVKTEYYTGKIFIHGRAKTYGIEDDQRVYSEVVSVDAFLYGYGVSISFSAKGYDPKYARNLAKLVNQFVPRKNSDIPTTPGFCIDRVLIRDPLRADQTEGVTMFAGLPGHPDLAIAFSTMVGTTRGPGILARNTAASAREPFYVRAAFTTLREGKRTINGLAGEELALRVREANFTTGFSFDWEMGGRKEDVYSPLLTLEVETGSNPRAGGKPVQSSLSESALIDLWDKISSSIRVRPANPPKAIAVKPVVPPLGTYATAGESCPQSGWWLCSEGGNGVGMLGGQRQYLNKGQRMPQALMLPPQTLWQKVRGLQPSYESDRPTAWKLVDKRSQARSAHEVPLVPAIAVARADAASSPAGLPARGTPAAPVGTYVKTGAPCPASGWWRCEESHAIDGTRWFAQGSLLPAATFQVPPGAFGRSVGRADVIQRRSTWQLIRYAQAAEPAEGEVDAAPDANPDILDASAGPTASEPPTSAV